MRKMNLTQLHGNGDMIASEDFKKQLLSVLTLMKEGDFSARLPSDLTGLDGKVADALNSVITNTERFGAGLTRLCNEVGRKGKVGERLPLGDAVGGWAERIEVINSLMEDLSQPTVEMGRVIGAVAKGDLTQTVPLEADGRPLQGEYLRTAKLVNSMVEQLADFSVEVIRVAREVGTEGKLGGQAQIRNVSGVWRELTESVNQMAGNLTAQVRNIAEVTIAVANGDLSKKITVDVRGEILQLKEAINVMVDQLRSFAAEVTRVAREVGTEGKLGGQAQVAGVAGTWKDLTDNVNSMASNLTAQVRNIAQVTTAVARGDLSRKITVDVKGEILELKDTINVMVDQLNGFASEVTRVAREVGTEGKLGGQAEVPGVAGTWKDLTVNVNLMANNLTGQVRNIADVTTAVARGDLSRKITVDVKGEILELKDTVNTMVDQLNSFAAEVTRVAREVGTEGKLGGQAQVPGVAGTWKDLTDNVNSMASNLTAQVRNIAQVTTAVARGDLSRKITVDVKGEILELKDTVNTMVDQLNGFASEVTRVAREVGTEGKLGGQAQVPGVGGTWKDLTDNVNFMAANLTDQVRGIVKVVTAVADGNLRQKLTVEAKGEVAALADTINNMTDTLAIFAEQVTNVAREVGVEGRLGGQANVPGAAGTWKDLTGNVNLLAANLTTQVRAIAEVATAVTKGDLTRSIQVETRGEVAELKDNINTMIDNLRVTTESNQEQDWLKTNLAKFTGMLQGQRDLFTVGQKLLSELVPLVEAQQGAIYQYQMEADENKKPSLSLLAGYAQRPNQPERISIGEGLVGQCALEKQRILLNEVKSDYTRIQSSLGDSRPVNIVVLPLLFEGQTKAVIELASLHTFKLTHLMFLEQLAQSIGVVLNTIEARMRTENLLRQSQQLTGELQSQQKELQQTNVELAQKARQLAEQNVEVERKSKEVEQARRALEEKAAELALTSKYKSEFLANMSHELRTPLNSILILGQQLGENSGGNLTTKQVEFARNIYSSGSDLLNLITDILDLSKIESGTVTVEAEEISFTSVRDLVERNFRHVADSKRLPFHVEFDPGLPGAIITDSKRLQQILKNLLSNAFKFTAQGHVTIRVVTATAGWTTEHPALKRAPSVISFAISDTGIGIAPDKQKLIFEAFQQADAGTGRKYGGTGLGLAISRELAALLGGEIRLTSSLGGGSTFTLYLPLRFPGTATADPRQTTASPVTLPAPREEVIPDDRERLQSSDPAVLIVEDDPHYARILVGLARDKGFKIIAANRGNAALALARQYPPTAIMLDIFLPDMTGFSLLEKMQAEPGLRDIPVVVFTGKNLTQDEEKHLKVMAKSIVLKDVQSPKRLLDETALFLHHVVARLPDQKQKILARRHNSNEVLYGRKVLVVDDDARNIFALTTILENQEMEVLSANNGRQAIEIMHHQPELSVVLMDIMMPEMDGYDTLREIRKQPEFHSLPILALTAKAMKGDREKCLEAGASDYIAKPVNADQLISLLRVWLHRETNSKGKIKL